MRILLIVVYYPPNPTSAAQMMRRLALEYVRQGHTVTVVAPDETVIGNRSVTNEDGVTVVRVRAEDMKGVNKALRLWRESRLSAKMWRRTRDLFHNSPCDLIVFYSPTIFFGGFVRRLKKLWGCPAYLILRDIFPRWAVETGILREGGLLHRYLRRKELEQYDAADMIGVEARSNLSYFAAEIEGHRYRAEFLPNWMTNTIEPPDGSVWRARLGLEGKVVFFYGGNIGVAQDMDNILRLAISLREQDDIAFLLVGEGSEVSRLHGEIARLGLTNVRLLPAMPESEYMQCLNASDVGLVSLERRLSSHNFPGKVLGYMSCSKPVLASVNPGNDLIEIVERAGAGIARVNGEDKGLFDAALLLASQPLLRQRMGENSKALGVTTFSVRAIAEQILSNFAAREDTAHPAPKALTNPEAKGSVQCMS